MAPHQHVRLVAVLAEARVAVEAQDPADRASHVVVVDMTACIEVGETDGALPGRPFDQLVHVSGAQPVPALKVVVAEAAVDTKSGLTDSNACAAAAVRVGAAARGTVLAESVER
jgi:hypothetical protein